MKLNRASVGRRCGAAGGDEGQSAFIRRHGYYEYGRHNVETYRSLLKPNSIAGVLALSSGFMTYAGEIHPDYTLLFQEILSSPRICISNHLLVPGRNTSHLIYEALWVMEPHPGTPVAWREASSVTRIASTTISGCPTAIPWPDRSAMTWQDRFDKAS